MSQNHTIFYTYDFYDNVADSERLQNIVYITKCQKHEEICNTDIGLMDTMFADKIYRFTTILEIHTFLQFQMDNSPVDRISFLQQAKLVLQTTMNRKPHPRYEMALEWVREKLASENSSTTVKIEWVGKKGQLGYIFGLLAHQGYIEAPRNSDGEINYQGYARLLMEHFGLEIKEDYLAKALNPDGEVGLSPNNRKKFTIPNIKELG